MRVQARLSCSNLAQFAFCIMTMATIDEFELPSYLVHRNNRPPQPEETDERRGDVDNEERKPWVVKLNFGRGGACKCT